MKNLNIEMLKAKILLAIQFIGISMFINSIWNKSGAALFFIAFVLIMSPNLLTGRWRARFGYFLAIIGAGLVGLTLNVSWSPIWAASGVIVITAGVYQIFRDFVDNVSTPRKALEKISKTIK
ncbi:hypothetical protein [Aeromonas hydrophila]|uniref:hypothetical protein n=1 Tax=Aeromonas hydrophila TaxID=644 RepID=UPI002B48166A|nr:hypothetical protein [Aeromonas hydrophila]